LTKSSAKRKNGCFVARSVCASIFVVQVAVQDTLNEQEGAGSLFSEPLLPSREERTPPLDLHPVDQRWTALTTDYGPWQ